MVEYHESNNTYSGSAGYIRFSLFAAIFSILSFVLNNGTSQVTAENRDGATIVFDADRVRQSRSLATYIQNEWTEGFPLQNIEALSVNGLQAATGWARVNTER